MHIAAPIPSENRVLPCGMCPYTFRKNMMVVTAFTSSARINWYYSSCLELLQLQIHTLNAA